ncbi:hypothetical protein T440DRAFT_470557 [Plenodomus tracheiphilus IPT5]|uniref:SWR1-complex protein 4 n=1 Tax=Plenodomus tracheiphilus IPT5 TaxID=1408161 RepID=A0A6A7B0M7_9PLEO|nr:hypothetical protein T440DRAFT_470557 [Plenodomus tracheiphilus IPT5]
MASGRDVRDMLGLPAGGDAPKAASGAAALAAPAALKRPGGKPAGAGGRKIQGVAREVAALYGERPPPVAVYEEKKAYRAKRQSTGPAKKWIQQPFTNPARHDGLVLKHWKRKPTTAPPVQESEDAPMQDPETADIYVESCTEYVKYDIKVDMPTFTDEEYDAHLRSDDWSREETDYLFEVVQDYSYRWAVIWDRYEYEPSRNRVAFDSSNPEEAQALASMPFPPSKKRSVEDLKARFYEISAKLMKLRIPEVSMDADQYSTYEMLTKFDPVMERNRKMLATALINRTMDEVKEEEFLLTELQRINMAANRLDAEREELRARLEAPTPNPSPSAGLQAFSSSQALQALFQQLFQQDRSKKRASGGTGTGPGRLSLSANDMVHTPGSAQQQLSAANRRTSMAQHAHSASTAQTPVKHLSPHQEHRFNVSTHDRLTSGVTFGSDKLLKMRQAKSNVQTQKIAAMLATLGVSEVISIPTSRVGDVFEGLVGKVGRLLDVRKVREKEEGECRVLAAMKERRAGGGGGGGNDDTKTKQEIADTPGDVDADGEVEDDEDDVNKDYEDADADVKSDNENEAENEEDGDGDDDDDEDAGGFNGQDVDDEDEEMDGDGDVDAEGEDDSSKQQSRATSQGATATSTAGHKRSASVFSAASGGSGDAGASVGTVSKRARK